MFKKDLIKKLKKSKIAIGIERDKLQKTFEELLALLDATNQGMEALEDAIYHFNEQC